ncbi:MAG TPA: hypothetical protein VN258_14200 [Mobilitalea sp.]|nr:hypothetical protein [Mobilitalea sp.]
MKLNKEGFITHYLISGPKEIPYTAPITDINQLRYEKKLRSIIAEHPAECPTEEIKLEADSELKLPWEYYFSYGNWFVDKSSFYSNLTKVELVAAVNLNVSEDMVVEACLWSYAAIDLWINKVKAVVLEEPVYKPIARKKFTMNLKKGENSIYIKLQNLGVRDTRNLFGIQILKAQSDITVTLPDSEAVKPFIVASEWLSGVILKGRILQFPTNAPVGTRIGYDSKSPDVTLSSERVQWVDISGKSEVELEKNRPFVLLSVPVRGKELRRKFEILEEMKPVYLNKDTVEENLQEVYERISDVVKLDRGENIGFSLMNILARIKVNRLRMDDIDNIYETLDQIESRMDCADFMVCALIRYIKTNALDDKMKKRIKEVLLNFRYWMDQDGADAMCFWSENHSLMFYVSAMQAGELYPDEFFVRAHKTGRQLQESSRKKVLEWLADMEEHGFEEFLSGIYMCITFIALLNTIDFSEEEITEQATKITDRLFYMISLHTFQGSVIAPQGRVYRDVLYPFQQGLQALVNMLNPHNPYSYGEGWLGFYATSKYRLPLEYVSLMEQQVSTCYTSGNAMICLNKTRHYVLTSVQSPCEDTAFIRWENNSFDEKSDVNSHAYIQSLNERFHGTTCFEPGVYGYQQHLWSAALAPDTIVFVNHPGGPCDESSMRPGYWFGNGVMPAIKQIGQAIASIYCIPEEHPIDFTHIHFAKVRFEEWRECGPWLIGKKGGGYVGIWASREKEAYNDQLSEAEYRIYSRTAAYLCVCSDAAECDTLDDFLVFCLSYEPVFSEDTLSLHTSKALHLIYKRADDRTQVI